MTLDPFQKNAAFHNYPYSLIIAGAGTGKTYTLLGRIHHLIEHQGLNPEEILVISYTNETVNDFERKALKELGISIKAMTFHKLAILLLNYSDTNYQLSDESLLDLVINEFLFGYCFSNPSLRKIVHSLLPFHGFFMNRKQKEQCLYVQYKDFKRIIQFILAKGIASSELLNFFQRSHGKNRSFLLLVYILVHLYQREKESQMIFDFDDLITIANSKIDTISTFPYRHILIDEFQDSSPFRMQLFQHLVHYFQLHFTVVGDDCQSIYRFSGTETNCFSILQNLFPETKIFYLKYTYRNSQELINIANKFILKNTKQIKKEICSFLHVSYPVELLYYTSTRKIFSIIKYILSQSADDIMFLGRNSFDWKYYFSEKEISWIDKTHFSLHAFPNIKFTFLTVHQSKGLEATNVILLHVSDEVYGFPNRIDAPSYMKFFYPKEVYPFEEERRLFYVALTRARKKVYILVPLASPSSFVRELSHREYCGIKQKFF